MFVDDGHFGGPNRVFSSQLNLLTSELSFTDDDGSTWLPTQGPGSLRVWITNGGRWALAIPAPRTPRGIRMGFIIVRRTL